MPNTAVWQIPYAGPNDAPNGYGQEQSLAEATDRAITAATKPAAGRRFVGTRPGTSDNFPAGTFTELLSATLPANAPAGTYLVTAILDLGCTVTTIGNLKVIAPDGTDLAAAKVINPIIAGNRTPVPFMGSFQWGGGAGTAHVQVQVTSGTGSVLNPGARIDVLYVGP